MDNMREQNWQSLLFVISIIVFGTGIYFYLKNRHARHPSSAISEAEQAKEVEAKSEEDSGESEMGRGRSSIKARAAAIREAEKEDEKKEAESEDEGGEVQLKKVELAEKKEKEAKPLEVKHAGLLKSEPHEHMLKTMGKGGEGETGVCKSVSFAEKIDTFKVDLRVWNKIIILFHKSKELLLERLAKAEKSLQKETVEGLKNQLKLLKIAPPPWKEEPHLKWQSLGLWVRKETGATTIHVSEEFFRLFVKEPRRAQFEMTRLVAQSWAPCELDRMKVESPWDDFLSCLETKEACSDDFYSEGGWAVSSGLAATLSSPGCTLPAFSTPEGKKCLSRIGLSETAKTEGANE